ncbi:MAG: trigger factor [SAR324 cluster bacterium]|nr:trigger factor [SAR324 cluster bacterium]
MESIVEELGKLKYSVALEISLEEIKPTYNAIYRELKNTRLNGFRPGKHPKGWLDKRFMSAMQKEAVKHIIPRYMDDALKEHSLRPVTVPVIQKIDFNRKSPLSATLHFEISPKLPPLDYGKILLERKDIEEVSAKDIAEELDALLQREEVLVPKDGVNAKVENDDWVLINFNGTIGGEEFVDSNANDMQIKIGGSDLAEFHAGLLGMSSGEEKEVEVELPERFGENAGKKANFKILLTEISTVKRPKMDEDFFKKYGVAGEDELKDKVGENIKSRKTAELQSEYRIAVRSQLSGLFDEFDLPEELVKFEQEQIDKDLEKAVSDKEISAEEKEKKRQEGYDNVKLDLRMKFILDSISGQEEMHFDENEAAREFVGLAQITGQSPDKLIQSPFGRDMYQRIVVRKQGDATLDRVVARVFGDPIDQSVPVEQEHVHDKNCGHDHS